MAGKKKSCVLPMLSPDKKQILLRHVDVCYDDRMALTDISLEINRGDFALIIGPNGGGKTTLLRLIAGLLRPDRGEIRFYRNGVAVSSLDIGYLPQKSSIDARFPITVSELVSMGLQGCKLSRSEARTRCADMLQHIGLSGCAHTPIGELSGGQLQRALFGRALITRPEILVLDEPTSYVDPQFAEMMLGLLREAAHSSTVLLVTHEPDIFAALATRTFKVQKKLEEIIR